VSLRKHLPWLEDADRLDVAIYVAIAGTATPSLDRAMRRLSRAADYSRLTLAAAGVLSVLGGRHGRRAAREGLAAVAVTSAIVNAVLKPVARRRRPDRPAGEGAGDRYVRMPGSRSFPSGHSASAFAFATGVGQVMPRAGVPLRALAALVAYSRVHTGVHYPADVVSGALLGSVFAQSTAYALERRHRSMESGWRAPRIARSG
jgi:membrane-associated phospholipid phosphatase